MREFDAAVDAYLDYFKECERPKSIMGIRSFRQEE